MKSQREGTNIFRPYIDRLDHLMGHLTLVCFVAMMGTLFWQVFSRFIISVPATWTEEAARYCFMYMTFFGAALGVRHSTHFGVTLLAARLRGRARDRYIRLVIRLPILLASVALLYYGTRYMLDFGFARRSPTFHFPMAWVYLVIPLSALPMTCFAAYNLFYETTTEESDPPPPIH